jgi:hypothetical protein
MRVHAGSFRARIVCSNPDRGNNRRARFYRLTRAGRKQLLAETRDWEQTAAMMGRFVAVKPEDLR